MEHWPDDRRWRRFAEKKRESRRERLENDADRDEREQLDEHIREICERHKGTPLTRRFP